MRTVHNFPTETAMLVDVVRMTDTLERLGWRQLTAESDTLVQHTWQHDQHGHDIVIRWTANLCDHTRWDRQIDIVWWRWPEHRDEPVTHTFHLPVDVPVEAAAATFDDQPLTLATVISMCGVVDLREAA